MASFTTKKKANKNQFTARLVSKKTGAMVSWVHITDEFARKVFESPSAAEVTAVQAEAQLPVILNNSFVEVVITDLNTPIEQVDAKDF